MKISIKGEYFNCLINANSSEIVDGDIILCLNDEKKIIVMNNTASCIWKEIQLSFDSKKDISDDKIAHVIMKKYDLDNTMYSKVIEDIAIVINKFKDDDMLILEAASSS